jgi:ABC-2 type transport system permease protein
MSKVLAIARRELRSAFDAPVAYIVLVVFLLASGWMVFSTLFLAGQADLRILFTPGLLSPAMLLVILSPAVTMRLLAEERRSGTLELLTTMPVSDWQVITGKFLGGLGLLATGVLLTLAYPITVSCLGPLDWGPVAGGYLGLVLFGAALTAVGLCCSALTSNQIVAFIVAFSVSAVLYFVYWLQFFVPEWLAGTVEYLSLSGHLENLARGVVDLRDVIYYLTLTGGALLLGQRALARRHA